MHLKTPSLLSIHLGGVQSEVNEIAASIKRKRRFALFVGAGISINAGIPGSKDIIHYLKTRYPTNFKNNPIRYNYVQAFDAALPGGKCRAERRRLIEKLFAGRLPSEEHQLIAHLVEHKKIQTILTTNFDHLTETALVARCSLHPRIYLYDDDIEPQEISDEFPKLFKLHGDFLFDDLANLDEEMRHRLSENMRAKLLSYLKDRGLIVLGYGGNDETIMNFLEEAVRTPRGMKNGVWWVIYSKKDLKNRRLMKLIRTTRNQAKRAEIIGPIDGISFLKKLCVSLGLDFPKPIPFGINPMRKNPISAYLGRFGRARQLPPMTEPESHNANMSDALCRLENALKTPGVLWLFGPATSGKTALIGKLFAKLGAKRLFYFSPRFSRNPTHLSLAFDLEAFANAIGISTVKQYITQDVIKSLFRKGVILAFDDLFLEGSKMTKQLWEMLIDIIASQAKVGQGNVILVSSREPGEEPLIEIRHGILEAKIRKGKPFSKRHGQIATFYPVINKILTSDSSLQRLQQLMKYHFSRNMMSFWPQNYQLFPKRDFGIHPLNILDTFKSNKFRQSFDDSLRNIFKNGKPELGKTLNVMSLLRFAEYAFALRKLVQIPKIEIVLNELVQKGVAENRGLKYLLRDKVQVYLRQLNLSTEQDRLELAKRFEELSLRSERRLDSFHYLSEAENLYFTAGNYSKAAELAISTANRHMKAGSIDIAYRDLLDFMWAEAHGKKYMFELTPRAQIELLIAFFKAWKGMLDRGKLNKQEDSDVTLLFNTIASTIKSDLPRRLQDFLEARLALETGDFDEAMKCLLKAEQACLKQGPSQELGAIQSGLSEAFQLQSETQIPYNQESLRNALRWAAKARATYLKINDLENAYLESDNIAACLLNLKLYEKALHISEKIKTFISKEEGFTRDKGVIYGNIFSIHLAISSKKRKDGDLENAKEHAKQAEGYFFESNLNFAYALYWEGLIRNFAYLFQFVLWIAPKDVKGPFPTPFQVYQGIYRMWFWAPHETFELVWKITLIWSDYNINRKHFKYIVSSLRPFLKLTYFVAWKENEKEAIKNVLYRLTRIHQAFGNTIIKNKILPIILENAPGQSNLYECYFEWLTNSQLSLEQLFKKYEILPEWEQVMKQIRSDSSLLDVSGLDQLRF